MKYLFSVMLALASASCFLLFAPTVYAAENVDVVMFYGNTCPHCHRAIDYLNQLKSNGYPNLRLHKFEVYADRENIPLFFEYANQYGIEAGAVPTIFIGDESIRGFDQARLTEKIEQCSSSSCDLLYREGLAIAAPTKPPANPEMETVPEPVPAETVPEPEPSVEPNTEPQNPSDSSNPDTPPQHAAPQAEKMESSSSGMNKITLPAVIAGAAVDAINPCAFAVLIILITTILGSSNRRRAFFAGLAFAISIYISYYLMGLGLYSAVAASGLSRIFYIVVAILAIIIGLFNLKDWLWYGRWFVMEVPLSWRPKLQKLIRSVTSVPGAFFIGFLVSLFLLPCTSGPYVVILGLLSTSSSHSAALWYLALYNAVFILPMIIITLAVTLGLTTADKAESWRQSKLRYLHLIAGIIILGLGLIMLGSILTGHL